MGRFNNRTLLARPVFSSEEDKRRRVMPITPQAQAGRPVAYGEVSALVSQARLQQVVRDGRPDTVVVFK